LTPCYAVGTYHPRYGVTFSPPTVVGRKGVIEFPVPDISAHERHALERSAGAVMKVRVAQ
jgi:hypothetical protein